MSEKTINKSVIPAISVVLVTKGNKILLLERCIRSLQNQTFRDFEIILVYTIFPEQLRALFDSCNIIIFHEDYPTVGAARKLGVKNAKGELITMIDDDAEAPNDWLEKIYSTFQRYPTLFCLGGSYITPKEESRTNILRYLEGSFLEAYLQKTYVDSSAIGKIGTCNVTYRKTIFERIGFFNENLRAGEDWEFNERLAEKGYTLRFDPSIFVWHHRQGLKHTFQNSSNMVPFYLSWRTLKYSRYESIFASFYLSNLIGFLLLITPFISIRIFVLFFLISLFGHTFFTAIRTRTYNWRIIYFPLAISFTLVRLLGFYFGLFKYTIFKVRRLKAP